MKQFLSVVTCLVLMSSSAFAAPEQASNKDKFKTMPALNTVADKMNERAVANKTVVEAFIASHQEGGKPVAPPALNPSAEKMPEQAVEHMAMAEELKAAGLENKPDDIPAIDPATKMDDHALDAKPDVDTLTASLDAGRPADIPADNSSEEKMPEVATDAKDAADDLSAAALDNKPAEIPSVDPLDKVDDHAPEITDGIPEGLPAVTSTGSSTVSTTPAAGKGK